MLNLLTTITNFTAYYPILTALRHGDITTASVLGFAAFSSGISHLFESHTGSIGWIWWELRLFLEDLLSSGL